MNRMPIHIANLLVLAVLLIFNLFVLWAFGIGEGGMHLNDWIVIVTPFVLWAILYPVQLLWNSTIWRWVCFAFMIVFLYLWETGYGALLLRTLDV